MWFIGWFLTGLCFFFFQVQIFSKISLENNLPSVQNDLSHKHDVPVTDIRTNDIESTNDVSTNEISTNDISTSLLMKRLVVLSSPSRFVAASNMSQERTKTSSEERQKMTPNRIKTTPNRQSCAPEDEISVIHEG